MQVGEIFYDSINAKAQSGSDLGRRGAEDYANELKALKYICIEIKSTFQKIFFF